MRIGYNVLLRSCLHALDWRAALFTLAHMWADGPEPELVAIATALEACVGRRPQVELLELLQRMALRKWALSASVVA